MGAGAYAAVADELFNEIRVHGFFLEYDDERSGGFEPLRLLPTGKRVALGLVTTKRGVLETADELKRRIEAAAQFAGLEALCLAPQCGFASTEEGNELTEDEQWAKLERIVAVAEDVWGA
jgi:5-methyltetrahydropteroyltriglutamate--homocysteine methyltransferase